jgi:tight adherence protein C
MGLLFVLGTVCLGVAATLFLRALVAGNLRVAAQMRQIDAYGFSEREATVEQERSQPMGTLADRLGRGAIRVLPSIKPLALRELRAAGRYELTVERFHGYRILATLAVGGFVILIGIAGSSGLLALLGLVTVAMVWVLPAAAIRTRGQRRLERIDRDLPELIDVLAVTIEAGMGFAGSFQLLVGRFEGPLGDELRLTTQEQTMGLSSEAALENLLLRCDTPSMRSFVRSVRQGEDLGVSIGSMLRNVATEARKRRRAQARERAQRAPLKLLFPLIFLIFPAMLMVLMFPTVYDIVQTIGGGG